MERKNKKNEIFNKIKVENEEGLTVSYDKDELNEKFPHLVTEITGKKKSVKINAIENKVNLNQLNFENPSPKELFNPGAIDFLRRCTNTNEALNILDYLLKQEEISQKEYISFKDQIRNDDELKEFIDKHGGFKNHGYYEKKYRNVTRTKLKQNRN